MCGKVGLFLSRSGEEGHQWRSGEALQDKLVLSLAHDFDFRRCPCVASNEDLECGSSLLRFAFRLLHLDIVMDDANERRSGLQGRVFRESSMVIIDGER